MKTKLFVLSFLFFVKIEAQSLFIPGECSDDFPRILQKQLSQRQQQDLSDYNGRHRDELEKVYHERQEELIQQYKDREFLVDSSYQSYLDGILQKINNANSGLKSNPVKVILGRSPAPNAYCRGDGILVINLGLIQKLENEAQLAFVLCHEMAHQLEDHVNKGIIKRVDYLHSKETQKKLKKINKQEYNKTEAALKLLEKHAYSSTRHMRNHERAADSIALSLLIQTDYLPSAALRVMEILDVIDRPDSINLGLETVFNFETYPFRTKWISEQKTGISRISNAKKNTNLWFNIDSLKTHPDCKDRRTALSKQLVNLSAEDQGKENTNAFMEFRNALFQEQVAAAADFNRHDLVLFYGLQALKLYAEDPYSVISIGHSLNAIYELQRDHELGKYIPQPSTTDGQAYRQILRLIHQIRLSEIRELAFHFLEAQSEKLSDQEDLLFEWYISCKNSDRIELAKTLQKRYKEKYPDGRYRDAF